jgi:hypothetical protein
MAKKSSKQPTSLEVKLIGGPLNGKKFDLVHPLPKYVMLGMGRFCYKKLNSTEFGYTEDKQEIELLQKRESIFHDTTKN